MAGHSKWAQIKRKKAAVDAKRGAKFTKLIREITVSARAGGGDPDGNPRLRLAIETARSQNMPQDNIERAVKKGTGELEGVSYEEATYEGYGPGGAAILVEVATDNLNRTVAEIRHAFSKHGGNLGAPNSVAWMFDRWGQVYLDGAKCDEDTAVRDALVAAGLTPEDAELAMIPKSTVQVAGKDAGKLLKLMSVLDDNDDVSKVFSNFDIDAETLAAAGE
jgi:YebC/PmpR family DNA-binding regulatory protein